METSDWYLISELAVRHNKGESFYDLLVLRKVRTGNSARNVCDLGDIEKFGN